MTLRIVTFRERQWVLGAEMARLLRVETFNLYRSLQIRGHQLLKVDRLGVEELRHNGVVSLNAHSATLIGAEDALLYLRSARRAPRRRPQSEAVAILSTLRV